MNGPGEDSHRVFRDFLSEIDPQEMRALRHLLACPLCQEMTRLLLTPIWPPPPGGPERPERPRPSRRLRRPRRGRS